MPIHPPTTHESHQAENLASRAAVVTGASSGIGRAIAIALATPGADVVVHARANRDGAEETARAIRELGRDALVTMHDLRDPDEHDALIDAAWGWRPIDIWINNAGADVLTGVAATASFEEKLDMLLAVDVVATIRLARAAGERMTERGGVILNMGWDQAATGMAGDSGEMFAATKGAIAAFTKSLAKSLAPNVRVLCLAPGWIRTQWGEQASDAWRECAESESLVGRWGTPEDVARVARFLVSDGAAFVNGQVVNIDGGMADI